MIGLSVDRESLRRRVEERVRTMFAAGWGDEVRGLLESGVSIDAPSMESVGYREIADALMRGDPAQNAIPEIVSRTMRYAKRQMTWWKNDKRIHWVKS
jgi:tRNA dimethylallyltransferase